LTVVEVVGLLLIIVTGLAISASPVPEAASARTLGLSEMAPSDAVAADVMGRAYGAQGILVVSLCIAVATLTSANAPVFTGARM
jgi:hypothetical protein